MNLGDKRGLDAILKDWPAPILQDAEGRPAPILQDAEGRPATSPKPDEEGLWEQRATATVKAALDSRGNPGDSDALLAAPPLPPEEGEGGVVSLSGEKKMAENNEVALGETTNPPSVSPVGERRRTSLKEIAARASQAGMRPSSPGTLPSAPGLPPPSSPAPATRPSVAAALARPSEASKHDSGVVDLNIVHATATAQDHAAASKAQPAQAGLFDDDHTIESAVNSTQHVTPSKEPSVTVVAAKRNHNGPIAGAVIAAIGIAAALTIVFSRKPPPAPVVVDTRPTAVAPAPITPAAPAARSTAAPQETAVAVDSLPAAEPGKGPEPAATARSSAPGALAAAAPTGGPAPAKEAADPSKGAVAAAPTGKPGDLQSEMARAVGPIKEGDKPAEATPEPAAARAGNQNIPEQPSQGSVQAAIGTVMGGAKACVTGADDVSRAQVTFSSGGTVSSVSVSGWAAANGKTGCIQAALKGAKVGPFSKPSFVVGVPIRP